MLFYSEKLDKFYKTLEEANEAEAAKAKAEEEAKLAKEKASSERAADAKKVEEAYAKANEACKAAREELREFCKKHGSYHKSYSSVKEADDLFDWFFGNLF